MLHIAGGYCSRLILCMRSMVGPLSVEEISEVVFLALYFCIACGLVGLQVHLFKGLSCPSCFLQCVGSVEGRAYLLSFVVFVSYC